MRDHECLNLTDMSSILFGHAAFQYLSAACELGLFDFLQNGSADKPKICDALGLAERAVDILLLGCTTLGLLRRSNESYALCRAVNDVIGTVEWERFKNTVAFEQHIVYLAQADLTESLRTNSNVGLRRIPGEGKDLYHRFASNPELARIFYTYMHSWSDIANEYLVDAIGDLSVKYILDCGGGDGVNAIAIARAHPRTRITVIDISNNTSIARENVFKAGLEEQVDVVDLNFFTESLPTGFDAIVFAHQLVIWSLDQNVVLLRKACDSLPPGGKVIVFNSMSNDTGDGPFIAAMDSAYFATLPTPGGMIYSWSQLEGCLQAAGFTKTTRVECRGWTPHGLLIGEK